MGYLRFILALLVALQHLGGFRYFGSSAVYVFFLISGYLMTRVIKENYGHSPTGFLAFWLNRFLRLYPTYFVVLVISFFVLRVVGSDFSTAYVRSIGIPEGLSGWLQNIFMLYTNITPIQVMPRIVPPTWALTLELVCYFLISIGVARTERRARYWLILGLFYYFVAFLFFDRPNVWLYYAIPSAFVPFAVGAILYHQLKTGKGFILQWLANLHSLLIRYNLTKKSPEVLLMSASIFLLFILVIARYFAERILGLTGLGIAIHLLNIFPATIALWAALHWRMEGKRSLYFDHLAGDLAYPIYLLHFSIGILVAWLLFLTTGKQVFRGVILFSLSFVPMLSIAYIIVACVDVPVQRLRDRVRPDQRHNMDGD